MHKYPTGWPKERPHWSKRTQVKELLQTIIYLFTDEVENINNTNKGRSADCSLTNRKEAAKDPEAQQSYSR